MRFALKIISIFLLVVTVAVTISTTYIYNIYFNKSIISEDKIIEIPSGAGLSYISDILYKNGVIENREIFKIVTHLLKKDKNLKAGEYKFTPSMTMYEIAELLESGEVILRQITIPEGLTSFEIVQYLRNNLKLTDDIKETPKEGSLLPETYSYSSSNSLSDIIKFMQRDMDKVKKELWEKRLDNVPVSTLEEAVILASIIEKETAKESERKTVAGVFANRLKRGMKLQTDPTVIYAITGGKHENSGKGPLGRRLLKKDLNIDSPYNTYKYAGLPPTPIANPGKSSIEAAINPEDNDYLYFVADGKGGHAFAKSLKEHNINVANWRKIRREQKK